jgi:hypothetical protein
MTSLRYCAVVRKPTGYTRNVSELLLIGGIVEKLKIKTYYGQRVQFPEF